MQHLQKQNCVLCGETKHNGLTEKFRFSEAPHAKKNSQAANYLQDVFNKIANLEEESSAFGVGVHHQKTCSSYFLFL